MKFPTFGYILFSVFFMMTIFSCSQKETPATLPTLTPSTVTNIASNSATIGGLVTSDGGASVTVRGACWSSDNQAPTISDSKTTDGSGLGFFSSTFSGLVSETTYFVRAYATNSVGTVYGSMVSIVTLPVILGPVSDSDGNSYATVVIGTQVWMAENLKTTKYIDGSAILYNNDDGISYSETPGYCWYNDNAANKNTYGALYNWFAVNTGKLCPTGWHVPTYPEWWTLVSFLGGTDGSNAEAGSGGKMKETGTIHWKTPNTGATNSSGFSGLPGGSRPIGFPFQELGDKGFWWTSTSEAANLNARFVYTTYDNAACISYYIFMDKRYRYSVRCMKD
jgi:uncharacterized protein (TIGR02145 family)